jgi:hypothetical protein
MAGRMPALQWLTQDGAAAPVCSTPGEEHGNLILATFNVCTAMKIRSVKALLWALPLLSWSVAAQPTPNTSSSNQPALVTTQPVPSSPSVAQGTPPGDILSEVIKMIQARTDPDVIKTFIGNWPTPYSVPADEVLRLHDLGAPNDVLTTLISRSAQLQAQTMRLAPGPTNAPPAMAGGPEDTNPPAFLYPYPSASYPPYVYSYLYPDSFFPSFSYAYSYWAAPYWGVPYSYYGWAWRYGYPRYGYYRYGYPYYRRYGGSPYRAYGFPYRAYGRGPGFTGGWGNPGRSWHGGFSPGFGHGRR